ncbi:MAG: hypothetical protein FWE25_03330 [Lachnospiraceae bacterium]|nr:hypothetical protein [Lachnospiraceae bacterium]
MNKVTSITMIVKDGGVFTATGDDLNSVYLAWLSSIKPGVVMPITLPDGVSWSGGNFEPPITFRSDAILAMSPVYERAGQLPHQCVCEED